MYCKTLSTGGVSLLESLYIKLPENETTPIKGVVWDIPLLADFVTVCSTQPVSISTVNFHVLLYCCNVSIEEQLSNIPEPFSYRSSVSHEHFDVLT